jgi:hypothetical protein
VTGNQISLLTVLDFVVLVVKLFFNHLMTKIKTCICIHNNCHNVALMILSNYFNSIAHCLFFCCIVTIDC